MLKRVYRRLLQELGLSAGDKLLSSDYDRETVEIIRRILRRNDRAVDVGAHEGCILHEILRAAPEGSHLAFEPIPELAGKLRRSYPNVEVHEAALSDKPGRAEFHHVINDPGYSGLRQRTYDRPDPKIETIDVAVTTLDEALKDGLPVRFIKLDIEGGEYHALLGGRALIKRDRPFIVFEAGSKSSGHYGVSPGMFYDLFLELGYSVSTMKRWLNSQVGFDRAGLIAAWEHDYYFIAYPNGADAARTDDVALDTP